MTTTAQASITDGTTTISFLSGQVQRLLAEGSELGQPEDGRRQIVLPILLTGTSPNNLRANTSALLRMLNLAEALRTQGQGRHVKLQFAPFDPTDGSPTLTTWWILRGKLEPDDNLLSPEHLHTYKRRLRLLLDVEPYGFGPERTSLDSSSTWNTLHGKHMGITHVYLYDSSGASYGVNLMDVVEGDLFQTTKFSLTPTTVTPGVNDILYFGNTDGKFDRLVFGLLQPFTVSAGSMPTFTWEYYNGSVWTSFVPSSNSFKTTTDFDTAAELGQIVWDHTALTGWATVAINSATCYWVRAVLTAVGTVSQRALFCNGPIRSRQGYGYIASTDSSSLPGDQTTRGLVYLKNTSGNAQASIYAGAFCGLKTDTPPPWIVPLTGISSSDEYINTNIVDASVQAATGNTVSGGAVKVTFGSGTIVGGGGTVTDRAIYLNHDGNTARTAHIRAASSAYSSGNTKLKTFMYNGGAPQSFILEIWINPIELSANPTPLLTCWAGGDSGNLANSTLWFGIDKNRPKLIVSEYNGITRNRKKKTLSSSKLSANSWTLLTLSYDATKNDFTLRKNGILPESMSLTNGYYVNWQNTTLWYIGWHVGMDTDDKEEKNSTPQRFRGKISSIVLYGKTSGGVSMTTKFPSYTKPTGKRTNADTDILWLLEMDDNAASTQLTDDSTQGGGAIHCTLYSDATTTSNTNASVGGYPNSVAGRFDSSGSGSGGAGGGGSSRYIGYNVILTKRLPQTLFKEWAGSYLVLLRATPKGASLTSEDDIMFSLQASANDVTLPFVAASRKFRAVTDEYTAHSAFQIIELGVLHTPMIGQAWQNTNINVGREAAFVTLTAAHNLTSSKDLWLDCLYFIPLNFWNAHYETFRGTFLSAYDLDANGGVVFDSRGHRNIVQQAASNTFETSGWTYKPVHNPYIHNSGAPVHLFPKKPAYLVAIPQRGSTTDNDHPYHVVGDYLQGYVRTVGQFNELAEE